MADPTAARPNPAICLLLPYSEDKSENGAYELLGSMLTEYLPGCAVFCRHNSDGDFLSQIADVHMGSRGCIPSSIPMCCLKSE